MNLPAGVDNGLTHFQEVLDHVEAAFHGSVGVGWLNHTRGGQWTTPPMPEALAQLRARGFKKLVYFPWGFTTDNAETMLEGRIALRDMPEPFELVEYLECMNSYPGCRHHGRLHSEGGRSRGSGPSGGRVLTPGTTVGRPCQNGLHAHRSMQGSRHEQRKARAGDLKLSGNRPAR